MAGAVEPNGACPSAAVVSLASMGDESEGLALRSVTGCRWNRQRTLRVSCARCAYFTVVITVLWPSSREIADRLSPIASAWEAKLWRQS